MNYHMGAMFRSRAADRKLRWLMISFAVCWGLLGILVVLQDNAIDAQRELIRLLLQDLHQSLAKNVQLHNASQSVSTVAGDAVHVSGNSAVVRPQVPATPSATPKLEQHRKALSGSPSSQVKEQSSAKSDRNSRKAVKQLPVRPPAEVTDPADKRRVTFSI